MLNLLIPYLYGPAEIFINKETVLTRPLDFATTNQFRGIIAVLILVKRNNTDNLWKNANDTVVYLMHTIVHSMFFLIYI